MAHIIYSNCQFLYRTLKFIFQPLLEALVTGLEAEPRVAANVCWAFTSLAEAAYEQAEVPDWQEGSTPATYKLSKYFPPIVERYIYIFFFKFQIF